MSSQVKHPPVALLFAYARGQLVGDRQARVERHVSRCARCARMLAGAPDDTFLAGLRQADAPTEAPTPVPGPTAGPRRTVRCRPPRPFRPGLNGDASPPSPSRSSRASPCPPSRSAPPTPRCHRSPTSSTAGSAAPAYSDGLSPVVNLGANTTGTVGAADHDVFQFSVGATQFVEITVDPTGVSQLDPVLFVTNSAGTALSYYDDDGGPGHASKLIFQAVAGTSYKLVGGGYDGNSTGTYRIATRSARFPVNPQGLPDEFAIPGKGPVPLNPTGELSGGLTATPAGRPGPQFIVPLPTPDDGPMIDAPAFPSRSPGFARRARSTRTAP